MKNNLLLQIKRANLIEKTHFGFICIVNKNEKIISQVGNSKTPFFLRSCAKPFQALPIIKSGTYEKFNFNLQELAIFCASHVASDEHLKIVKNIFNKINLTEENLKCGIHAPFDKETKNYLFKNNLKPSQIHNNCSGKHAGMLAVCLNNKWDINSYTNPDHPLQEEILTIIQKYCNVKKIEHAIDSCSLPTYGMPLYKMGAGFLKLFLSDEAKLIKQAFIKNPVLIGGKEKLDSLIMQASQGRLIAKLGAEGCIIIINLEEEKALVIKILDGDMSARSIVSIEALKQLGWLVEKDLKNARLQKISNLEIKDFNNNSAGEINPVFKL